MDANETNWGGSRHNSGRKKLNKKRKHKKFYLVNHQWDKIKEIVNERGTSGERITETSLLTEWIMNGLQSNQASPIQLNDCNDMDQEKIAKPITISLEKDQWEKINKIVEHRKIEELDFNETALMIEWILNNLERH